MLPCEALWAASHALVLNALRRVLGEQCSSKMCMLWAAAVRDPCPGSGWTGQPLWMRWRARMRERDRVSRRATVMHRCVLFEQRSRGQISVQFWTYAMILGVLDTSGMCSFGLCARFVTFMPPWVTKSGTKVGF